jgi:hypothetical protein
VLICVILGSTFTGAFYDVAALDALVSAKNAANPSWELRIHVDAASGGFLAPFANPDLKWDFRLENVASINASGHKFGQCLAGLYERERADFVLCSAVVGAREARRKRPPRSLFSFLKSFESNETLKTSPPPLEQPPQTTPTNNPHKCRDRVGPLPHAGPAAALAHLCRRVSGERADDADDQLFQVGVRPGQRDLHVPAAGPRRVHVDRGPHAPKRGPAEG